MSSVLTFCVMLQVLVFHWHVRHQRALCICLAQSSLVIKLPIFYTVVEPVVMGDWLSCILKHYFNYSTVVWKITIHTPCDTHKGTTSKKTCSRGRTQYKLSVRYCFDPGIAIQITEGPQASILYEMTCTIAIKVGYYIHRTVSGTPAPYNDTVC